MSLKLLCLDFDGTVADTMPWLEENAVQLFLKNYEVSEDEARQKYRSTTGLPFEQQVELIFPNHHQNPSVIAEFEEQKVARMSEQQLFPETTQVLNQLKERGYIVAISSSTTKSIITAYVEEKGIAGSLDEVVGFRPGFEKGRHHFEYLMAKYHVSPDEMMYVGDSMKDMERAWQSKVRFVARLGPMFTAKDFQLTDDQGNLVQMPTISSLEELFQHL